MLRRILAAIVAGILAGALYVWWNFWPVNVPFLPPPKDSWEALLRERIKVPEGFAFSVFARELGRPRLMQMTAAGDLIVSGHSSGTIMLVKRDGDGDGRSDATAVLKDGLQLPHGLWLEGDRLIVAEEHRVVSFQFDGASLTDERVLLEGLPDDGGHSSRTVKRGPDGLLYVAIGSTCNACIEDHPWRAAMIRFKEGEPAEIFATGLRNTVGFDWHPESGALYGVDNGRDQLGDDVPDDEVNLIAEGGHYGWPFMHGTDVKDPSLGDAGTCGRDTHPHGPRPRRPRGAAVDHLPEIHTRHRPRRRTRLMEPQQEIRLPHRAPDVRGRDNHRRCLPHRLRARRKRHLPPGRCAGSKPMARST